MKKDSTKKREYNYKKGHPGGPGRPKDPPELVVLKMLTKTELELLMNTLLTKSKEELKAIKVHGTAIQMSMAAIILKSIEGGDHFRLQFFIERLLGKVPDKVEHDASDELIKALDRL